MLNNLKFLAVLNVVTTLIAAYMYPSTYINVFLMINTAMAVYVLRKK